MEEMYDGTKWEALGLHTKGKLGMDVTRKRDRQILLPDGLEVPYENEYGEVVWRGNVLS